MVSALYSKFVLDGYTKRGGLVDELCRITGLSAARIKTIASAKASFTQKQLSAIEKATGRTAGQLALATLEPNQAISDLVDSWAELKFDSSKPKKTRKRATA